MREAIVPIRRRKTIRLVVEPFRRRTTNINPQLTLVAGFLMIVAIGTVLLTLPFSSESGEFTSFPDALFTATSATGTVGLVVVDTATHWSRAGQVVILVLMEVGGLGFMGGAIVLFLALGRTITIHQRRVFQESLSLRKIGGVPRLARRLIIFTLLVEGIGALLLFAQITNDPTITTEDPAWWSATFHAVSAYTGSGFDLMGGFQSLQGAALKPLFLLTMMAMIIPGDLGFLVVLDLLGRRKFSRLTMETKIILSANFVLWPLAALGFFVLEFANAQTLGEMPLVHKITNSIFQAVTVRNAGFSTVTFAQVGQLTLVFFMVFMVIGAASASMGGGLKVNTLGALVAGMRAGLLGRPHAEAFGRTVSPDRIYVAVTLLLLYGAWIAIAVPIVFALQSLSSQLIPSLFDSISALGPIGLSTGVPASLSLWGKIFMSILMFVGRLGPLTVALALLRRTSRTSLRTYPVGDLRVG
ncbi:MAG: Trk family potassium uptake protein [Chloroflexi bacterium]|nr:Trk family potassium uptake protein [Chloroflexota bacterium]MCY3937046.1 Trk family potassium uptake protein [Chloroflexota bacterium]